ncbi:MAG: hypothetical protein DMF92_02510 [Acidobacteria bacterium]|nr:MAG: hypothetical protein DMF92_02510 [Acidobacteriota bacterium]
MFTQLLSRALATTAAIVGLAVSASAQCQNPTTDAQRAQCLGDELRGADRTINRVYAELVKSLPPPDRLTLRDDERAWLKTRDRTCGITWSQGDRATWFADLLRDYQKTVCVVRLTNERVTVLNGYQKANAVAAAPPAPAPSSAPVAPAVPSVPSAPVAPSVPVAREAPAIGATPVYDIVSEPKSQGKWYFEVKVDPAGVLRSAEAAIFIGVTPAASDARAINSGGSSVGTLQSIRRIDKNLDPQVFGFAVDLDNGRLYVGESGAWPDGEPGSAGGNALIQGRGYRMMLTSSVAVNEFLRSGTLTVNLGERGFVYSVPAGYRPLQPR